MVVKEGGVEGLNRLRCGCGRGYDMFLQQDGNDGPPTQGTSMSDCDGTTVNS